MARSQTGRTQSFSKAAIVPECESHHVVKVETKLTCGEITAEIVVPTPDKPSRLRIVVLPEETDIARETFTRFRLWAEDHRPDWIRVLNGLPSFVTIMLAGVLSVLFLILIAVSTGMGISRPSWRDEARDLAKKKDMTQEDQGRALQLLLRREFDEDPSPVPFWVFAVIGTILGVGILLAVQATTAFEIGKGKASVRRQKWYAGFLRKSIPAFLLCGVLASTLGSFVFEYLRSR